ncbi:unnamed protein product [Gongylonema pulchrum]|uniref:Uncharacterized protein n=1 Tax=Gongylonema pulchrum TaxID=637853 RepID=A0A183DTV9_9BILA|nr:unnamed protein product [Gongylonema pulchrum]
MARREGVHERVRARDIVVVVAFGVQRGVAVVVDEFVVGVVAHSVDAFDVVVDVVVVVEVVDDVVVVSDVFDDVVVIVVVFDDVVVIVVVIVNVVVVIEVFGGMQVFVTEQSTTAEQIAFCKDIS